MSDKKVKVSLSKAMTWAGVNYAPGINTMPEAAAKSAINRKLGAAVEGQGENQAPEDFTPLGFEETMDRFQDGDTAPEVFQSLKYYQPKMAAAKKAGMTPSEFLALEPVGGKTNEGLPENFPMRHIFDKLGFKTVEEVQAKSFDELVALDGIAEASATKALAYGK